MANEMLGNQYFLARNYVNAASNFKQVLSVHPENKSVRKKIIICYTQMGDVRKAFQVFRDLVEDDIEFIINTNTTEEYCPCPDLIEKYGSIFPYESDSVDLRIVLSMLWLYCDPSKSVELFKSLKQLNIEVDSINSIIKSIESRQTSNQLMINQPHKLRSD